MQCQLHICTHTTHKLAPSSLSSLQSHVCMIRVYLVKETFVFEQSYSNICKPCHMPRLAAPVKVKAKCKVIPLFACSLIFPRNCLCTIKCLHLIIFKAWSPNLVLDCELEAIKANKRFYAFAIKNAGNGGMCKMSDKCKSTKTSIAAKCTRSAPPRLPPNRSSLLLPVESAVIVYFFACLLVGWLHVVFFSCLVSVSVCANFCVFVRVCVCICLLCPFVCLSACISVLRTCILACVRACACVRVYIVYLFPWDCH